MREKLDAQITTTTTNRRHSLRQRFGIPAVAAAAVAAIAIGGYLLATNGGDDGGNDPAGGGSDSNHDGTGPQRHEPKEHGSKEHGPKTDSTSVGPSTAMADPAAAYQKCIDLTDRAYKLRGEPIEGGLTGRLAIENEMGITVVVTSSTDAYTCNVKPDKAVSRPAPLDGKAEPSDFWFALNYTGNVLPGNTGDMVWVGGEVPDGVTGIRYSFPNGHVEEAVLQDGFWALQYYSHDTIPSGQPDQVKVTLEGIGRVAYALPFNANTQCNQISHGC